MDEDPSGGKAATIKRNLHGSHKDPSGGKAATIEVEVEGVEVQVEDPWKSRGPVGRESGDHKDNWSRK